MKSFLTLIKSDYLQRSRSYAFLITVCFALALGYSFVPEPNASYSTITISGHQGYYNSAWFGYVTAIMTTIFVSLFGFYLVNSGIKRDMDTKVGHIIAATQIQNFKYLFSKTLSNFIILMTIALLVLIMSIVLFFTYNDGYPFEVLQFIKPYLFIVLPVFFFMAALAVVFEVIFRKYTILHNIVFFFCFIAFAMSVHTFSSTYRFDVLGTEIVIEHMENKVRTLVGSTEDTDLTIGYVMKSDSMIKRFEFKGIEFPIGYLLGRLILILIAFGLLVLATPFFHRFSLKNSVSGSKKEEQQVILKSNPGIAITSLAKAVNNFGILPLVRTELKLLFRKGKPWLWLLNLIGMALLGLLSIDIAYQLVLPILWFLQVHRLADITSKAYTGNVHYFTLGSYKPISRLLAAQVLSATILLWSLVIPLAIRLLVASNNAAFLSLILGAILVVLFAVFLGMLTRGKKLFEILFFLTTYLNINGIEFFDYFGALTNNTQYILTMILVLIGLTVVFRKRNLG